MGSRYRISFWHHRSSCTGTARPQRMLYTGLLLQNFLMAILREPNYSLYTHIMVWCCKLSSFSETQYLPCVSRESFSVVRFHHWQKLWAPRGDCTSFPVEKQAIRRRECQELHAESGAATSLCQKGSSKFKPSCLQT